MIYKDILHYLTGEPRESLFQQAHDILLANKGKHVLIRGLIEFSNICRRNCRYCGLRAQNARLRRYRLSQDEILDAARDAARHGADSIVLQSGEGACQAGWLAEIIQEITSRLGLPVTLSVGERAPEDYELWRKAGAARYLLKHETADPRLYRILHPGYALAQRIRHIKILSSLGYETGSGFMIGLPGQSLESLAADILLCRRLKVAMCGAGPFIAQKDTPLAAEKSGDARLALRILATLRIFLPHANLPATTALATVDPEAGQSRGLDAGANVLMPSFTPPQFAKAYAIYDNKNRVNVRAAADAIEKCGRCHSLIL